MSNKPINVLVIGSNGFLGGHLVKKFLSVGDVIVLTHDRNDQFESLFEKISQADFIFHMAGVNRPQNSNEFFSNNVELIKQVTGFLISRKIKCSFYFPSSLYAGPIKEYSESKKMSESYLSELTEKNGNRVIIDKLPNIFGYGAKPNYNSVVATFCECVIKDLIPPRLDSNSSIQLVYIDDWLSRMMMVFNNQDSDLPIYFITVGDLYSLILSFKNGLPFECGHINFELISKLRLTFEMYNKKINSSGF